MRDEQKTKEQLLSELTEARQKIAELENERAERKFVKAFKSSPDPLAIVDLERGKYTDINDAYVKFFGYEPEEVIGKTGLDFGIWLSLPKWREIEKLIRAQGNLNSYQVQLRRKTGEIRTYLLSAETFWLQGKQQIIYAAKDITERSRMEEALRVSEERFSKAFHASPVAMTITSIRSGKVIGMNESASKIFGYDQEEVINNSTIDLGIWINPAERLEIKNAIVNRQSITDMERAFYRNDGSLRIALFSAESIEIDNEPCVLSIITDITERKQAEEEIRYLNYHDKLTGLYNRVYFEEQLTRLDQENLLPISIIMADVNGLKLINDTLGPKAGDKVLEKVAAIINKSCYAENLVARWGGDEFIILLPGCDYPNALKILEKIVVDSSYINDLPIQASVSFGLATKASHAQILREVIKEAEEKMYRNKLLEGRSNRSTFLKSLQETLWSRSCETEEHCQRMQDMAYKIGLALSLPDHELDNLKLLAALHDIGKIAIPNSILDKPQKLTADEWDLIKKHPETGYRIARSSPELAPIAEAILHHHERWDGNGYPLGAKGEDIPMIARTIAILDAYDVMINGRPYKAAMAPEEAWAEIESCAGSQFDPRLVKLFRRVIDMDLPKSKKEEENHWQHPS